MKLFPLRRWTPLMLMVVVIAYFGANAWMDYSRENTRLDYCIRFETQQSNAKCTESKTLLIPASFGRIKVVDDWYELKVAYPSMQPWDSISWAERRNTEMLTVRLRGLARQTPLDLFRLFISGGPTPTQGEPVYGLKQFTRPGRGEFQVFLPIVPSPGIILKCVHSEDPADLTDPNSNACAATSFTEWDLKFDYLHRRALIPEWRTVHASVTALIESFVINP